MMWHFEMLTCLDCGNGRLFSRVCENCYHVMLQPTYSLCLHWIVCHVFLSAECALEDETYEDGAETQVECNRCVCACGNWVCTAMTCTGKLKHWFCLLIILITYFTYFEKKCCVTILTFYLSRQDGGCGWVGRCWGRDDGGGMEPPCGWAQQAPGLYWVWVS